jgi:hypothetical protein
MRTAAYQGRHRLGLPGLVHCLHHPQVQANLRQSRRRWMWSVLRPARHSLFALRGRAVAAQQALSPTPA